MVWFIVLIFIVPTVKWTTWLIYLTDQKLWILLLLWSRLEIIPLLIWMSDWWQTRQQKCVGIISKVVKSTTCNPNFTKSSVLPQQSDAATREKNTEAKKINT